MHQVVTTVGGREAISLHMYIPWIDYLDPPLSNDITTIGQLFPAVGPSLMMHRTLDVTTLLSPFLPLSYPHPIRYFNSNCKDGIDEDAPSV